MDTCAHNRDGQVFVAGIKKAAIQISRNETGRNSWLKHAILFRVVPPTFDVSL